MKAVLLKTRFLRSLGNRKGEVLLRRDLAGWASPSQLTRTLQAMLNRGVIVRLGYGVYAKAKPSLLSGRPVPRQPLEVLASETFQRLAIPAAPGGALQAYAQGSSPQIPMQAVFRTGNVRCNRRLGVGSRTIRYERNQRV